MNNKRARIIAWGLTLAVIGASVAKVIRWVLAYAGQPELFDPLEVLGLGLTLPTVFSVLAALIIARQPGNRVGWLMMIIGLAAGLSNLIELVLVPYTFSPPDHLTLGLWLMIYLQGTAWVPTFFPLFLIPLYFPTGHPPSLRWRWVAWLALGMVLIFYILAAITTDIETPNWTMANPIGVIPVNFWEGGFMLVWTAGLLVVVGGSVASLYVRYRGAGSGERQQIKVLLLAGVMFAIFYSLAAIFLSSSEGGFSPLANLLFMLTILGIPAAIAISIFRYRLWDLDVVINRALIYGPLTTVMAGTFAMVIALTTELTKEALGDQSKALGAAISAVIVAVVFQPLRDRIEAFVDKHFYPQKLDLASGLVEVQPEYWGFLDQEMLTQMAMEHVSNVLGTEHVAFYLPVGQDRYRLAGQMNGLARSSAAVVLSKKQSEGLQNKRVVATEGMDPLVGHVPLFVDRGKSNEMLGLLSIGSRADGRGYSGDDLKGLVELGGKIGLAINAIQMRERLERRGEGETTMTSGSPANSVEGSTLPVR
ncbi:MAG: hypothetical protein PVF85_13355 [Anaerolineales bacterium]|jgi:hypothetical protein